MVEQFYRVPVDPEIRQTVRRAGQALADLTIPAEPFAPQGLERAPNLWWFFIGQLTARLTRADRSRAARPTLTGPPPNSWPEACRGQTSPHPPSSSSLLNLAKRDRMRAALLRQMEEFPVLLMPPCGVTAFPAPLAALEGRGTTKSACFKP